MMFPVRLAGRCCSRTPTNSCRGGSTRSASSFLSGVLPSGSSSSSFVPPRPNISDCDKISDHNDEIPCSPSRPPFVSPADQISSPAQEDPATALNLSPEQLTYLFDQLSRSLDGDTADVWNAYATLAKNYVSELNFTQLTKIVRGCCRVGFTKHSLFKLVMRRMLDLQREAEVLSSSSSQSGGDHPIDPRLTVQALADLAKLGYLEAVDLLVWRAFLLEKSDKMRSFDLGLVLATLARTSCRDMDLVTGLLEELGRRVSCSPPWGQEMAADDAEQRDADAPDHRPLGTTSSNEREDPGKNHESVRPLASSSSCAVNSRRPLHATGIATVLYSCAMLAVPVGEHRAGVQDTSDAGGVKRTIDNLISLSFRQRFSLRETVNLAFALVCFNHPNTPDHRALFADLLKQIERQLAGGKGRGRGAPLELQAPQFLQQLTLVVAAVQSGAYAVLERPCKDEEDSGSASEATTAGSASEDSGSASDAKILHFLEQLGPLLEQIRIPRNTHTSAFQASARRILEELEIPYTEETPVGPYVVDYLLKHRVALEFDGWAHFYGVNNDVLEAGGAGGGGGGKLMKARSHLKHRILTKMGMRVVHIAYDEWLPVGAEVRKELLVNRIAAVSGCRNIGKFQLRRSCKWMRGGARGG